MSEEINKKATILSAETVSEMLEPFFGDGADCRVTTRLKRDEAVGVILTVLATDETNTVQITMAEGTGFYEANKAKEKKLDA